MTAPIRPRRRRSYDELNAEIDSLLANAQLDDPAPAPRRSRSLLDGFTPPTRPAAPRDMVNIIDRNESDARELEKRIAAAPMYSGSLGRTPEERRRNVPEYRDRRTENTLSNPAVDAPLAFARAATGSTVQLAAGATRLFNEKAADQLAALSRDASSYQPRTGAGRGGAFLGYAAPFVAAGMVAPTLTADLAVGAGMSALQAYGDPEQSTARGLSEITKGSKTFGGSSDLFRRISESKLGNPLFEAGFDLLAGGTSYGAMKVGGATARAAKAKLWGGGESVGDLFTRGLGEGAAEAADAVVPSLARKETTRTLAAATRGMPRPELDLDEFRQLADEGQRFGVDVMPGAQDEVDRVMRETAAEKRYNPAAPRAVPGNPHMERWQRLAAERRIPALPDLNTPVSELDRIARELETPYRQEQRAEARLNRAVDSGNDRDIIDELANQIEPRAGAPTAPATPARPTFLDELTAGLKRTPDLDETGRALADATDEANARTMREAQRTPIDRQMEQEMNDAVASGSDRKIGNVLRKIARLQDEGRMNAVAPAGAAAGLAADDDDEFGKGDAALLASLGTFGMFGSRGKFGTRLRSRLFSAVENAPFEKGTADQWTAALSRNVAKGEREYTGVDALLQAAKAEGRTLTRKEVFTVLMKNRVKLDEEVFTGDDAAYGDYTVESSRRISEPRNYREVVIQDINGDKTFKSPHFLGTANAITHVRMSDRKVEGKRSLFIEEIQDDHAQQGRDRGYRQPDDDARKEQALVALEEAMQRADQIVDEVEAGLGEHLFPNEAANQRSVKARRMARTLLNDATVSGKTSGGMFDALEREYDEVVQRAVKHRNEAALLEGKVTGNRPFKQTSEWAELGIKRSLDEAVQGGYSQVVFAEGGQISRAVGAEQPIDVDALEWTPDKGRDWGSLTGWRDGTDVTEKRIRLGDLDKTVGKTLADQLRASLDNAGEFSKAHPNSLASGKSGYVETPNYQLGGGNGKFYNELLPRVLKDYEKKLGTKFVTRKTADGNLVVEIDKELSDKIANDGQPLWAVGAAGGAAATGSEDEDTQNTAGGVTLATLAMLVGRKKGVPAAIRRVAPQIAFQIRSGATSLDAVRATLRQIAPELEGRADEVYRLAGSIALDAENAPVSRVREGGRVTNREAAIALTEGRENLRGASPREQVEALKEKAWVDLDRAIARNLDKADWYREDVVKARATMVEARPELADDENWSTYVALAAIYSPSEKPVPNFRYADGAWESFRNTGTIVPQKNERWTADKNAVATLNRKLDEFKQAYGDDPDAAAKAQRDLHTWLMGSQEIRTNRAAQQKSQEIMLGRELTPDEVKALRKTPPTREVRNALLPDSHPDRVFGEKTGAFFLNLMGKDSNATMDIWATRTFRRHLGYLSEVTTVNRKKLDEWLQKNPNATPEEISETTLAFTELADSPTEGERYVFDLVTEQLGKESVQRYGRRFTRDEIQALLWFNEKEIFKAATGNSTGEQTFSQAAAVVKQDRATGRRLPASAVNELEPSARTLSEDQINAIRSQLDALGGAGSNSRTTPGGVRGQAAADVQADAGDGIQGQQGTRGQGEALGPARGRVKRALGPAATGAALTALLAPRDAEAQGLSLVEGAGEIGGALGLAGLLGGGVAGARALARRSGRRAMGRVASGAERMTAQADNLTNAAPGNYTPNLKRVQRAASSAPLTQASQVDPDKFFRLDKASPDADKARIAQAVEQMVATSGVAVQKVDAAGNPVAGKPTITWDEVRAEAQKLQIDPERLIEAARQRGWTPAEALAGRTVVGENASVIAALEAKIGDRMVPDEEKTRLRPVLAAYEEQNNRLLQVYTTENSGAGRLLNSYKIIANQTLDPAVWLGRAYKANRGMLKSADVAAIQGFIDGQDRAGLAKYVADLHTPSAGELFGTFLKAGLLSSPKTHVTNFVSNTLAAGMEVAKDAPAAAADRVLRSLVDMADPDKVGARRTKDFSVTAIAKASFNGARKGLAEAKKIMRGEAAGDYMSRWDHKGEASVNTGNATADVIVNTYLRLPFRALAASDRIFRESAIARSVAEQQRILSTQAVTDDMMVQAIADAEMATFQQSTALGDLAQRGKDAFVTRASQGGALPEFLASAAAETTLPFVKTPSAVLSTSVEYAAGMVATPNDLARLLAEARKGLSDPNQAAVVAALQKRAAERLGRQAVGATAMLTGWVLAANGLLSAPVPLNKKKERDTGQMFGNAPGGSLTVGDETKMTVDRISPIGNLLIAGAAIFEALRDPENGAAQSIAEGVFSMGAAMLDNSFLQGVQDVQRATTDDGGVMRLAQRRALAAVPLTSLLRSVSRLTDDTVRDPQTFNERLMAGLPVASRNVAPRRDPLGNVVKRPGGAMAALNEILPGTLTVDRTARDPQAKLLQSLGATLTRPARDKQKESVDEYRQREERLGAATRREVNRLQGLPSWNRLSTADKRDKIETRVSTVRSQATKKFRAGRVTVPVEGLRPNVAGGGGGTRF